MGDIPLGVELWNHMVILFLTFMGTTKLFSIVTGPFIAGNVQGFQFLSILISISYCASLLLLLLLPC